MLEGVRKGEYYRRRRLTSLEARVAGNTMNRAAFIQYVREVFKLQSITADWSPKFAVSEHANADSFTGPRDATIVFVLQAEDGRCHFLGFADNEMNGGTAKERIEKAVRKRPRWMARADAPRERNQG
jgi:hypothetical protein